MSSALEHYGSTQRKLLESLLYERGGLPVEVLAEIVGVTPGAVRQHLAVLEGDGLVERARQQATGGRPQQVYTLSAQGLEAFPRRYPELAAGLIGGIAETVGPRALQKIMRSSGTQAGNALAARAGGVATIAATAA